MEPTRRSWSVCALALLVALTALRLAVAATAPLTPDEAYYWIWSRALAPGYPDHPPMVALWIRLGTLIAGHGSLGVRLLGPFSVAIASLLLMDAANRLMPGRNAGLRAAALLNATLLFGVGAVIITPDTPLLFFWTCSLWALVRLLRSGNGLWWLSIGLFAGLAMASKYTAALLWLGIPLWLLLTPDMRAWLRRAAPWLGALVAIATCLPIVWWNAEHDWASFARQGGRVGDWHPADAIRFLTELFAGQIGLVTPLIFVFCAGGIVVSVREGVRTRNPGWTLLGCLTVPATALFIEHALGDRVQGNWPAIIYPAAGIAAASLNWHRLFVPAIALGLTITLLAYTQAITRLLPLPVRLDPIALRMAGWNEFAAEVEAVRVRQGASFVASDQYGVAAELARGLPARVPVIGAERRWEWFDLSHASYAGQRGILVRSGGDSGEPALAEVARKNAADVVQSYRIEAVNGSANAVLLPRP